MTEKQKDFVQMYLKHNCKITAHNLAYGNNTNIASVESSANRLLNIPEIAETIRSIKDGIRHEVEQEFKAKYREELLTIYEKRLLLKKIATGEMYIEQKYKGKNCTQCSQYISPTYHIMMQALREDSRLAGHYPYKQNGKWVIPAQQTEQVKKTELSPVAVHQADEAGRSQPADGGGTFAEDNTPEKDNKRQHPEEPYTDNQPLTVEEENTTETPLLFLGGDIGASASGGDKRQSGWLTPDVQEMDETPEKDLPEPCNGAGNKGQQIEVLSPAGGGVSQPADGGGTLAKDETPQQKTTNDISSPLGRGWGGSTRDEKETQDETDNNLAERLNEANEKDINKRIKRQQTEETNTDNQLLTTTVETSVNSSGKLISQPKPNHQQQPATKEDDREPIRLPVVHPVENPVPGS